METKKEKIIFSGEDARKFERQITYGRPKKAAKEAYDRGKVLAKEYSEKGYATILPKQNKNR